VLGDMMSIPVDREFITPDVIAQAILEDVIATHPNAQLRQGPVTRDNPRGLYPVAPGSIPVTLELTGETNEAGAPPLVVVVVTHRDWTPSN